jgi:tRNA pseudouridine55 synthase
MQRYVVLDKKIGETPLSCMEAWRTRAGIDPSVPLTYAGRLDPLASGKLLVLIGEECQQKERYQALDKTYEVGILFGLSSDSGDALGLITPADTIPVNRYSLERSLKACQGSITLPYPVFSSKPVNGKPLHTWAAEGRLTEVTIPTNTTTIYQAKVLDRETLTGEAVYRQALTKIESIPPITDLRKALGNDFRRSDVRASWQAWREQTPTDTPFMLAHCRITCSSGTYMRSLAEHIGKQCGTTALAFSIHRTHIGRYRHFGPLGYFSPSF